MRDPSTVEAIHGLFCRRGPDMVAPHVDKEVAGTHALAQSEEWLGTVSFLNIAGLGLRETITNLLEAGEHLPMSDPAVAKVLAPAEAEENEANRANLIRLLVMRTEVLAAAYV